MKRKTRCAVLLLPVFAVLVFATPVQAFSFCFSFGNNSNKYSPYNRYPPPYPPPPAAFYPHHPYQLLMPGPAYSPVYPPLTQQPYGVLAPVQPAQQGQWQGAIEPVPETGN
jgi:hypothetical protein